MLDLSDLERRAIEAVSRLAPWLAPLPSAYFVARASIRHFDVPLGLAIVIGAAIETLGLTANATMLRLYEWNVNSLTPAGNLRKGRSLAPRLLIWLAAGTGALYLVVVIALTVMLEVWPELATYALAVFPFFALTGTILMAIRANQVKREADAADYRALSKRSFTNGKRPTSDQQPRWAGKWATVGDYRREIEQDPELRASIAGLTGAQFAERTGKPESTARRWVAVARDGRREND